MWVDELDFTIHSVRKKYKTFFANVKSNVKTALHCLYNPCASIGPCLVISRGLKSKTSFERNNYLRVVPPDAKLRLEPLRSLCERVGVRKPLVLVFITLLPICQSSSVSKGSFEPCLRTLKFSSIQSVKAPSGGWYFISNRMIIWRQERNERARTQPIWSVTCL